MSIVPVYRLRATLPGSFPRYRFSRDAHPNPNPTPGQPHPDPGSRWSVDSVAFYAWSDPTHAHTINRRLAPVYEYYRVDTSGRVSYRYLASAEPPAGWISREYVAFWIHPAGTDRAGAPVHIYSRDTSEGSIHTLSANAGVSGWTNESVLGVATGTVPVVVSVRRDINDRHRYHWSYAPSTINLSYATTIVFVQAPLSAWRFVDLEIPDGQEDFEPPVVTDDRIVLNARYANPGRDFKSRLTIELFSGADRITSDANAPDRVGTENRNAVDDLAVSDPEVVNQTPDTL